MSPGLDCSGASLRDLRICTSNGKPSTQLDGVERDNKIDADERIVLHVEVCQAPASSAAPAEVEQAVRRFIGTQSLRYSDGPLSLERGRDSFLDVHVLSVRVCDTAVERAAPLGQRLLFWQARAELASTGHYAAGSRQAVQSASVGRLAAHCHVGIYMKPR